MPSDTFIFSQLYEPGLDQPGFPDNEAEMTGLNVDPADWYAVREYASGLGDVYTGTLRADGGLGVTTTGTDFVCAPGYIPAPPGSANPMSCIPAGSPSIEDTCTPDQTWCILGYPNKQ